MFGDFLGNLFDKEKAITDVVQATLVDVAIELGTEESGPLSHKDFFLMIRPIDGKGNFKFHICKYDEKGNPKAVREITTKEILGEK